MTLGNEPVPAKNSVAWIGDWLKAHGGQPVQIMVRRDGVDTLRTVQPVMACAIPVKLVTDGTANAYTDYKKIVIQSGVLRLARNDADLAVIIGHELAHVTMGHYGKRLQNALVGELGGAVIDGGLLLGGIYSGRTFSKHFARAGAMAFSVEFEREADYVGAYYAARAGYDHCRQREHLARDVAGKPEQHPACPHASEPAGALYPDAQGGRRDRRQEATPSAAGAGSEGHAGRHAGQRDQLLECDPVELN